MLCSLTTAAQVRAAFYKETEHFITLQAYKLINNQSWKEKKKCRNWTHPTCGDDGVLEDVAAQLAAEFHWRLFSKHLRLLFTNINSCVTLAAILGLASVPVRQLQTRPSNRKFVRFDSGQGPTVSSSSSCREKVERSDMLDSEWRDRTEMAESDLRGVPIGGWVKKQNKKQRFSHQRHI